MSLSATCGVPPSPNNGFVDFTNIIEESVATVRCDAGPEMTAVCTASGEWVPNPGELSCSNGRPSSTSNSRICKLLVHVNTEFKFSDFIYYIVDLRLSSQCLVLDPLLRKLSYRIKGLGYSV